MQDQDIQSKLKQKYGKKKAVQLYQFYKLYNSDNPYDREFVLDTYDRSTIWRKLKELSNANIGIVSDTPFSLTIPSNKSVRSL